MLSLQRVLASFFSHPINGLEPRIVKLEEPVRVVGMSIDTSLKTIYRDVPTLGRRFRAFKQRHGISNLREPRAFVGVSKDFDEGSGVFSYMMGDVVSRFEQLPPELSALKCRHCPMPYSLFAPGTDLAGG